MHSVSRFSMFSSSGRHMGDPPSWFSIQNPHRVWEHLRVADDNFQITINSVQFKKCNRTTASVSANFRPPATPPHCYHCPIIVDLRWLVFDRLYSPSHPVRRNSRRRTPWREFVLPSPVGSYVQRCAATLHDSSVDTIVLTFLFQWFAVFGSRVSLQQLKSTTVRRLCSLPMHLYARKRTTWLWTPLGFRLQMISYHIGLHGKSVLVTTCSPDVTCRPARRSLHGSEKREDRLGDSLEPVSIDRLKPVANVDNSDPQSCQWSHKWWTDHCLNPQVSGL